VVLGQTNTLLVDTRDGSTYNLGLAPASSVFDFSYTTNSLFQCKNNKIIKYDFTYNPVIDNEFVIEL
jgi:hypothetical protein